MTSAFAGMVFVKAALVASAGAVTWIVIVQVPGAEGVPAGTVPFVKLTVRGNIVETVPPQVVVAEPGITVSTVPGNVSDNSTPVYAELVGLRTVILRVVIPPA